MMLVFVLCFIFILKAAAAKPADPHGADAAYNDVEFDAADTFDEDPLFEGKSWLNSDNTRRKNLKAYKAQYATAPLFPHIAIDNFFTEGAARKLLADFPKFEDGNYLNEYGKPGRKSVNTDIRRISPHYGKLWKFLSGTDFLSFVSGVTSIPDLLFDPSMFGGGTHENLNGQRLNTHIDFNYNREYRWHRRVNVLFYLNDNWECEWGGCIGFQSNPWCYTDESCNTVKQYDCKFNRAVIFGTSEVSWHGFDTINAPATHNQTRKLISIYLYTRNRPANEIAGAHGTHYIPTNKPDIEAVTFIKGYMAVRAYNKTIKY